MADKKIKKILIFACPRTGSTIIQKMIAVDLFQIPNLIEPFNDPKLGFRHADPTDLYQWTQDQTTGIMKLLAINLDYVDVDRLLAMGNFDRVVVIERKNLADCCVSLCLAEQTFKYHYYQGETPDVQSFECDTKYVDHWIGMYRQYLSALAKIKNSGVPYDNIIYEDFINDQVQYIAGVPLQLSSMSKKVFGKFTPMVSLELPYRDLCVNYIEVEKQIRKELC